MSRARKAVLTLAAVAGFLLLLPVAFVLACLVLFVVYGHA